LVGSLRAIWKKKKKVPVPLSATGKPGSAAKLKIPPIFDGDSMLIRRDAREMRRLKPALWLAQEGPST
jgi:hypothetical protein